MVAAVIGACSAGGQTTTTGQGHTSPPVTSQSAASQAARHQSIPTTSKEPTRNITVLPTQPIVNNIPAAKEGVNWLAEVLKLIPTFLAAYFGYFVAMKSVDKKAGIDENAAKSKQEVDAGQQVERLRTEAAAEQRRELGLIHQGRADALSTIIGRAFTFAAAAERTHLALTTMESYALSQAANADEKRQDYFAERARLTEAAALLNAEAEKYGLVPSELNLKKKYLTNYVHDWSDSFNRRANDKNNNRLGFANEAYAIVNDLRKLKEYEEAHRLALVRDSKSEIIELKEFDWLVD